jgi:hypothetical protein
VYEVGYVSSRKDNADKFRSLAEGTKVLRDKSELAAQQLVGSSSGLCLINVSICFSFFRLSVDMLLVRHDYTEIFSKNGDKLNYAITHINFFTYSHAIWLHFKFEVQANGGDSFA